ncbi:biotin transporter BioY [Phenylobacterium sp.]|uniref:biotin transporter BioY n=1 Tax=Phenylobacterium sp. TaxID=1871053 RepID=UPI0035AFA437
MQPAPLAVLLQGRPIVWRVVLALALSWVLAASSWAALPMVPAPMTLQTYALLTVAALAGPRLAFEAIVIWLGQAALGLPLLAGGAGGLSALAGPTAGFLAGFLVAGTATAWLARRPALQGWAGLTGLFLAAHAVILALGWAWLATRIGPAKAWSGGVWPFLPGAAVKSLAAAASVKLAAPALRALA